MMTRDPSVNIRSHSTNENAYRDVCLMYMTFTYVQVLSCIKWACTLSWGYTIQYLDFIVDLESLHIFIQNVLFQEKNTQENKQNHAEAMWKRGSKLSVSRMNKVLSATTVKQKQMGLLLWIKCITALYSKTLEYFIVYLVIKSFSIGNDMKGAAKRGPHSLTLDTGHVYPINPEISPNSHSH